MCVESHMYGKFKLDIWENFSTEGVVRHWNRVPRKDFEPPSLEVFNRCEDVALEDVV